MFSLSKIKNYFTDNPIARAELAYLRRETKAQSRWFRWPGNILFTCATLLAILPTIFTMYDVPRTYIILPIITVAVFIVHFGVMIRTLTLASHTIAREKETNNWDALVLTGQDARQIIMAKFWAVIRCVWWQHTLSAILRLGLAYGLAQFFTFVTDAGCLKHLGPAICYPYLRFSGDFFNYNYNNYGYGYALLLSQPFIMASGIILVWGFLEAGLLTGLSIFMPLLNSQRRIIGVTGAVAVRTILILLSITLWTAITEKDRSLRNAEQSGSTHGFMMTLSNQRLVYPIEWHQLMGLIQAVPSPFVDDGTILAAVALRPIPPLNLRVHLLMATGASIGLFLMLIRATLKGALFMAVRQSALRPAHRNQPSSTMMRTPTG